MDGDKCRWLRTVCRRCLTQTGEKQKAMPLSLRGGGIRKAEPDGEKRIGYIGEGGEKWIGT